MDTLSIQITPPSPTLFVDDNEDDQSGAGPSFDGAGTTLNPKTRNSLIGSVFGNRSPLPLSRKKLYLPTTPHTTPISSPKLTCDNNVPNTKRRGSVASPRLGDKLKGFLNVRRGSCIENPMKASLSVNYDDDSSNNSPYFFPISPSRSPSFSSPKYNYTRTEFCILEEFAGFDLEHEDDIAFASGERREYKNDISFDEYLARVVERMALEGYSDEQINSHLQKERERNQTCKDVYRPKTPTPTSWHSRLVESINRSFRFENAHNLLPEESKETSKNILELLPTEVFSEKRPKDGSNCTICLSAYTEGELLKSLPCFHCFHTDCLDQWLKVSCFCPVCKNQSI